MALTKATTHWLKGLPPIGTRAMTKEKIPIISERGSLIIVGRPEKKTSVAKDKGIAKVTNCLVVKLPNSLNWNEAICWGTGCCSIT